MNENPSADTSEKIFETDARENLAGKIFLEKSHPSGKSVSTDNPHHHFTGSRPQNSRNQHTTRGLSRVNHGVVLLSLSSFLFDIGIIIIVIQSLFRLYISLLQYLSCYQLKPCF